MTTEKTDIGNFLAKIGNFFVGLFNAAKASYNKLSPEVQAALINGSEILEIINANDQAQASLVLDLIKSAVPGLPEDKLLEGLLQVQKGLNIVSGIVSPTLEDTIKNLQDYLRSLDSTFWAGVSSLAAKLMAFALAPSGTKWAAFESLMEFVYQTYVKKD